MTNLDHKFLRRLKSDLRTSARTLDPSSARYMVDLYYQLQDFRKTVKNQVRSEENEENVLLEWLGQEFKALEGMVKDAMGAFASQFTVGEWCQSLFGVGPVISAGLIAHIDISKAKTAGSIWRFAGMDPTVTWGKGQKRPWNAKLKTLCWKFSDVQKKFSGNEKCFYGPLYKEYKERLIERNEAGEFAETAAAILEKHPKHAQKDYLIEGHLSPGHLDARAMRWVAKLFISHWHTVEYWDYYNEAPPKPYVQAHLGHAHIIEVPNWSPPK